ALGGEPRTVFFFCEAGGVRADPCRGGCIGEAIKGPARWVGPPYRGDRSERDQPAADIGRRFGGSRRAARVSLLTNFPAQRRHLSAMRSQVALLCGSLANFAIRRQSSIRFRKSSAGCIVSSEVARTVTPPSKPAQPGSLPSARTSDRYRP